MEHATHGDHQAAVELPTLFATVSSDGQHIRLEEDVFVRRILRSFSRRTPPSVEVFLNTYQTMEVGEYRAGSLHEYAVAVNEQIPCAQSRGGARCKVGIGTISMTKSGLGHTVGLLVHFDSKQVEVFDSRGCDMNSPHQPLIRRGYYSKQALGEFHSQIVRSLFPAEHAFTCLRMDQRFQSLQQVEGACRLGVFLYIFHRLKYPAVPRDMLYRRVKRSKRLLQLTGF